MTLLRSFSFYMAIVGLILAFLFILKMMAPSPPSLSIAAPPANPFSQSVAASGIIEAQDRNIAVSSPVSGIIDKIYVIVGQPVVKGQPLFEIESRDLQALSEVQKANIIVSKESAERLQDQLDRLEKVKDARAVSDEELKTKRHDLQVALAQVRVAEATYNQTKTLIDRLFVRSPKDGVVLQKNIEIGEYFASGGNQPALIIGDVQRLQIRADIDEQNAMNFTPGFKAVAYPRNDTTRKIPLEFSYIEPFVIPKRSLTASSEERVDTRVLQVIYKFEQPKDFPLYVGQQVDVFIETGKEKKE